MSFYKEVGAPFGLSEAQSTQMEQGFQTLEKAFHAAEDVNSETFAQSFYQQFETLVKDCGIQEGELEALVNHLYFTQEFQTLVTLIIPSYYNAGGDTQMFEDTYQLMLAELQLEQH